MMIEKLKHHIELVQNRAGILYSSLQLTEESVSVAKQAIEYAEKLKADLIQIQAELARRDNSAASTTAHNQGS